MGRPKTTRGYDLFEVISALQKAIRRGDAKLAGYWTVELFESGFHQCAWNRVLVISAEDCWGILTQEIVALLAAFNRVNKDCKKGDKPEGRLFLAKAAYLLALAKKSRDVDHLICLGYGIDPELSPKTINDEELTAALEEARSHPEEIPKYALDVHTLAGKRAGKTKKQFLVEEHDSLKPRVSGIFDKDLELFRESNSLPPPEGQGQ
jgi:hypothetical protein